MTISRRSLITAFSAAPVAIALPVPFEASGAASIEDDALAQFDGLWRRRQALLVDYYQLRPLRERAYNQLPDWAKPGLDCRATDGHEFGSYVGWPRLSERQIANFHPGLAQVVRPSPNSIRALYLAEMENDQTRHEALANYTRRKRALQRRRRQQSAEERRVGYADLSKRRNDIVDQVAEVEKSLTGLRCFDAALASLMLSILCLGNETCREQIESNEYGSLFQMGKPHIKSNILAADIAKIFDNLDVAFGKLRIGLF